MTRSLALVSCVAAAILAAAFAVQGQTQPAAWQPPNEEGQGQTPVMPVHQEAHHRQVFQYGPLRIIDLQIPPGDTSWFHTHQWPVFYLTVADSQTRTQILGEEWGGRGRGAGPGRGLPPAGAAAGAAAAPAAAPPATAPPAAPPRAGGAGGGRGFRPRLFSDVSYAERPVSHRIQNIGTGLYKALGVINETQGGDETVTEEAAGFSGKAESSNRWFRIHRVVLQPGAKTPAHQHKASVVVFQDSAGKGLAIGPMSFEFNEPGAWGFFDVGVRHEISNTGSAPLELIEVEVRRK
jgi:mannose-6-phosphate isomerase-like protein (cupin superfamily)